MESLKLRDGELFYEAKGTGPPLVLLHAGVADSRMWEPQFDHFAKHFQTVRCDLRGYGNSLIPDGEFSYYEDVLALVQALDLSPTWIIGASFGAQVAVDFYLAYPEQVRGLVLISPVVSGFKPSGDVEQFNEQEDALLDDEKLEEATELNLRMWVDGPYRTREEVAATVREQVAEMQLQAFSQSVPENASLRKLSPPAIDRLNEIKVPTLIVSGELDVTVFVQFSEALVKQVSRAKRVVIPGAAHMVSMENPKEFNQLVLGFISSNEHSVSAAQQ